MNFIKKRIAVLLLATSSFVFAEQLKKEDPAETIKRKVLVLIEEPNADLVAKMKPEDKETYLNVITKYNENIKEVLTKYATFGKSGMEFKTNNEILAIKKTKDKSYLVLNMLAVSQVFLPSMGMNMPTYFPFNEATNIEKNEIRNKKNKSEDDLGLELFLNLIEDYGDLLVKNPFMNVSSMNKYPSKLNLATAIQVINFKYNKIEKEANGQEIDGSEIRKETCAKNLNKVLNSKFIFLKEAMDENYDTKSMKNEFPYKFDIKSAFDLFNTQEVDTSAIYVSVTSNYSDGKIALPVFFEIVNHEGKILFYNKVKSAGSAFGSYKIQEKFLKKIQEEIKDYQKSKK